MWTVPKVGDAALAILGDLGDLLEGRLADKGRVDIMTGASLGGSDGVQMILLGRGSQGGSILSLAVFLALIGVLSFDCFRGVSEVAISRLASSRPNRLPRSLTELFSGGGITGRTSIAVTLIASCETATLSWTTDLNTSA